MLEKITQQTFEAADKNGYLLQLPEGTAVPLFLVEVKQIPASSASVQWGIDNEGLRRDSFSVVWRTDTHQPALGQGMYRIDHPEIRALEGLFLVPVAQDENGRYYEAIFN